jgi:hypothetical protein
VNPVSMHRLHRRRRGAAIGGIAVALLVFGAVGAPIASAASPTDLFISEYLEGSSNNKALEIYNGTGAPVDLGAGLYALDFYTNGANSVSASIALSGSIANKDVYVIANPLADPAVLAVSDATNAAVSFNGNDTIVLRHGAAFLDFFGQYGFDPGIAGWGVDPITSVDHDLVRASSVNAGDTNGADAFDPDVEWVSYPVDTFSNLGFHVNDASGGGPTPAPTASPDTGAVAAQVTVPSAAACLELSTSTVDFGTLSLGAEDQPGTPDITVTNCAGVVSDIYAHGSDASDGAAAAWTLQDSAATCADTLGLDTYRLGLEQAGTETGLATTNKLLESLAGGDSGTHTARIWMACPGSTGSGSVMSMQVVFLATTGG